jgi:HPt (histidine-containing phosphotransfer) domain-containing protein
MAVKRGIQVIDLIMDQVYEKPIDATTFVYLDAYQSTQKALAADDRLGLQQLAHKLQGSAALLGMQSLQQVALALEQTSAQATSVELDALVQHLVKLLQLLLDQTIHETSQAN